jgi:hypothetical protein
MLCMCLGFSPRILGTVMHLDKPGLIICLLCIRTAMCFLLFALTVHAVVLGAGSSFFAGFLACCRDPESIRWRLCRRCALVCSLL